MPKMNQLFHQLSDMVLFVAVVQAHSYAAAAKRLNLPASTLSRRITAFERKLGVQLIQRTTRSVELMPSAKAFFDACVDAMDAAQYAQTLITQPQTHSNPIRIAMPVDLGVDVLAPICSAFAHLHSQVSFDVTLSAAPVDLMTQPFDLAFRIGHPMDERVVARQIGEINTGLYAAPSCIASQAALLHPAQLTQWPCVRLNTGRGEMPWQVDSHAWSHTPGPARLGAASVGFVLQLTKAGHGVALLPQHIALPWCQSGHLVRLLPNAKTPQWPIYAVTASRMIVPMIRELIDYIQMQLALQYREKI